MSHDLAPPAMFRLGRRRSSRLDCRDTVRGGAATGTRKFWAEPGSPSAPAGEISPKGKAAMSLQSNHTDWTVPAQLRRRAAESPGAVAHQVAGGEALTFGAWAQRSDAVA